MLSMADILADPDLAGQPFTLLRRPRSVGEDGRVSIGAVEVAMTGSIQPAPAREMARLPEEDRQAEGIQVFAAAPIHPGGPAHAPDVILWRGNPYTVRFVRSWTQFGAPHVEALAVLAPVEGLPPP